MGFVDFYWKLLILSSQKLVADGPILVERYFVEAALGSRSRKVQTDSILQYFNFCTSFGTNSCGEAKMLSFFLMNSFYCS
jgi:hypothetical protein